MGFSDFVQKSIAGEAPAASTPATTAAPAPTTGGFSGFLVKNVGGAPAPAGGFTNAVAPPPTQYFQKFQPNGASIGVSDEKDTSGVPLLAFRNAGDTATTTDPMRVATTFDPRIPQKLTQDTFLTPRAVANRAALKTALGGSYSDQLDHTISLELAGSNQKANLRIEPDVAGTTNTATDPLENKLAKQVVNGDLSLWDAQNQLAQAKGVALPYIGDAISKYEAAAKGAKNAADYANSPLGLAEGSLSAISDWTKELATTVISHVTAGVEHPLTTAQGVLNTAVVQPLSFASGLLAGAMDQRLNAVTSEINKTTGTKIPQNVVGSLSAGAGKAVYDAIGGPDVNAGWHAPMVYNAQPDTSNVFAAISSANKAISRTPDQQAAFDTGNFLGWMVPYSGVAKGAEATLGAAKLAPQIAKLVPIVSDAVGFLGTGQILHSPDEGSRVDQLRNDAIALMLFNVGAFALRGGSMLATRGLSNLISQGAKETIADSLGPVIENAQSGKPVPIETLQNAVDTAKEAVVTETGKDPKALLQQHVLDLRGAETAAEETARVTKSEEDQKQSQDYVDNNYEKMLQDYNARAEKTYGSSNVVSADEAKHIIPKYDGANASDYHEASSTFAKKRYAELLTENKGKGNNTVMFTSGGTGAGKTSGLRAAGVKVKDYPVVYDGNLSSVSSIKKVQDALDGGFKVQIIYVQRDPVTAFTEGVLPRVNKENRVVGIDEHIERHSEAFAMLQDLRAKFGDKIDIKYVDNTGPHGSAHFSSLDNLPRFAYAGDELRARLHGALETARKKGVVTSEQARAIAGKEKLGGLVRGKPEQKRPSGQRGNQLPSKSGGAARVIPPEDLTLRRGAKTSFGTEDLIINKKTGETLADVTDKPDLAKDILKNGFSPSEAETPHTEVKLPELPVSQGPLMGVAFPGANYVAKFVEKDIIDRFHNSTEAIKGIYNASKDMFGASPMKQKAEAVVGSTLMKAEQFASAAWKVAEKRRDWWATVSEPQHLQFLDMMETGNATAGDFMDALGTPSREIAKTMEDLAIEYRSRLNKAFESETAAGVKENYIQDYVPHYWTQPEKAREIFQKYSDSLPKGSFTKLRTIELIKIGRELGLTLKTTNPEEIVLMREIDGVRIATKIDMMRELQSEGLAAEVAGSMYGSHANWPLVDGADGIRYAVPPDAARVLKNAFFEKSLWSMAGITEAGIKGAGPTLFRSLMAIKGLVVPIKLSLSAFHPIHIAFIHSASERARAWEGILKGNMNGGEALATLGRATSMLPQFADIGEYHDIIKAWDTAPEKLTDRQRTIIQQMIEGGFTPKMSEEFKIRANASFKKAVADENYLGAAIRGVPKLIEGYQQLTLGHYIPALKSAGYIRGVEAALRADPKLVENVVARKVAFRKIAQDMDNRYGQMNYKTLFWNPIIKQSLQAAFLSLGWTKGFVHQFGGGVVDLAKLAGKGAMGKATMDDITNRMLFAIDYSTQAALVGGLMTYAMTGKMPAGVQDLFFPQTGDTNPDGSPARVNTSFYTREWFSLVNHLQKQGNIQGTVAMAQNKLNPVLSNLAELYANKDFYGYQITNPNDPIAKRGEELLKYFLANSINPISVSGAQQAAPVSGMKGEVLSFAGFNPAPKYVSETPIQTQIFAVLDQRSGGTKPLDNKPAADAKAQIRKLYLSGDTQGANDALDAAVAAGYIKPAGRGTFIKGLDIPGDVRAFEALAQFPSDQAHLLSTMSEEDLARYADHASATVKSTLSSLSPTAKKFVEDLKSGKIKTVTFKKEQPVTTP